MKGIANINAGDTIFFGVVILFVFLLLFVTFCFGWWMSSRKGSVSPYSGLPMRKGSDLSYNSIGKVLRYLYHLHDYENRMFDISKAAVCRETGRIFSDSITWYDTIKVDWGFLQKRYPGTYVSWGSLTKDQQEDIRIAHDGLSGFQTGFSSSNPSPRDIEPEYAFEKPGPLYVDINTKVVVGWKCIPDSELEVLIVQKPKKALRIIPNVFQK